MQLPLPFARAALSGVVASLAGLAAQAEPDVFSIDPDDGGRAATDVATRAGIPFGDRGDVLTLVGADMFAGIGAISGFRAELQDLDRATPERFGFAVLRGLPSGGPGTGIARIADIETPTANGPGAVTVLARFATPIEVPAEEDWFFGIDLPAAPRWPVDGLAVHVTDYRGSSAATNPSTPGLGWVVDRSTGFVLASAAPRLPRAGRLPAGVRRPDRHAVQHDRWA